MDQILQPDSVVAFGNYSVEVDWRVDIGDIVAPVDADAEQEVPHIHQAVLGV